jgi:hypothetical protein
VRAATASTGTATKESDIERIQAWAGQSATPAENKASKGRNGSCTVPLCSELRDALVKLHANRSPDSNDHIIHSEQTSWCLGRCKLRLQLQKGREKRVPLL